MAHDGLDRLVDADAGPARTLDDAHEVDAGVHGLDLVLLELGEGRELALGDDGGQTFRLDPSEVCGIICRYFQRVQEGRAVLRRDGRIGDVDLPDLAATTLPLPVNLAGFGELFPALNGLQNGVFF